MDSTEVHATLHEQITILDSKGSSSQEYPLLNLGLIRNSFSSQCEAFCFLYVLSLCQNVPLYAMIVLDRSSILEPSGEPRTIVKSRVRRPC
ncbi:hypothetical protein VNO77_03947 [Canavalia gladiata]|uniref:Uncharacterized protein n=1 Tax=Canavalia gladiata TaxID=3824 RepID=A0AAN9MVR7_CANGL